MKKVNYLGYTSVFPWKKLTHRSQHYEVLSNRKAKTLLR